MFKDAKEFAKLDYNTEQMRSFEVTNENIVQTVTAFYRFHEALSYEDEIRNICKKFCDWRSNLPGNDNAAAKQFFYSYLDKATDGEENKNMTELNIYVVRKAASTILDSRNQRLLSVH